MGVFTVLALLIAGTAAAEVDSRPHSAAELWAELTPLDPALPSKVLPLKASSWALALEGASPGPAMVCAGGEGVATQCESTVIPAGGSVTIARPAAGVRVTGRVVVGKGPAAGAQVSVVPQPMRLRRQFSLPLYREGDKLIRSLPCDEKGRFAIPHLAPGDYLLDVRLAGGRLEQSEPFTVRQLPPAPEAETHEAPPTPVLDLGELAFGEGIRVEVAVVDSAGRPIKGAGVAIAQDTGRVQPVVYEVWANERGLAILNGLEAALPAALTCVARGYIRVEERLDPVPPLAQCVLRRFSQVSGTVLDEDEEPIAGATVSVLKSDAEAHSQADGAFSLRALTPGDYKLTVAAPGFRASEREVAVGDEEDRKLPAIRLQRAETILGRVVDATLREPIDGASVAVIDPRGGGATSTDEQGNFSLAIGAEGPVRLAVSAESAGYPRRVVEVPAVIPTDDEPFEIELSRGGWIRVTMWDEEADAPCAGCSATCTPSSDRTVGLTMDAQGEALSPVLAPGRYQVVREEVRSTGSMVLVSGGGDLRWATVEPGRIAEVQFGTKRESIEVLLWPPPPAEWRLLAESPAARREFSVQANGAFMVRRAPGEEVALSLIDGTTRVRLGSLAADYGEPVLRIALSETSVRGLLNEGDIPLAGESLTVISLTDGRLAASTFSSGTGAFRVDFLPPGLYSLRRGRQGREVQVRTFELAAGSILDLQSIEVPGSKSR